MIKTFVMRRSGVRFISPAPMQSMPKPRFNCAGLFVFCIRKQPIKPIG